MYYLIISCYTLDNKYTWYLIEKMLKNDLNDTK